MRNLTSPTLAVTMFAAGLVLTTTPTHAQTPAIKDLVANSGAVVAARVQALKRANLNVREAFYMFEKWGHRPKIEEASAISGRVEQLRPLGPERKEHGFAIRKANFSQSIREGRIELVFVPVLDLPTEWQGTLIARLYSEYNQVVSEEVFNIAMVQESTGRWMPVYELSFANGTPFLHYEPGMYAAFALGVSIADHPAVTGSAPDTNLLPWQRWEEPPPPPPPSCHLIGLDCPVSKYGRGVFRHASYNDTASRTLRFTQGPIPPQERFPIRCPSGPCHTDIRNWIDPRVRQTARDAFGPCVGAAIFFRGSLMGFVAGCGGSLINQAGRHIFRIW